jgi:ubiquinone/menaquinone biosynthesis C-methylase UbiE
MRSVDGRAAMTIGSRLFAAAYDTFGGGVEAAGLSAHRRSLLADATGRVLEVGAGTGRNLPFYGAGVASLTFAEPDEAMARRLERHIGEQPREVELVRAPAERLPFEDGRFDAVVSTLVLCSVPDLAEALGELRRVLAPGGALLFIEHVRSDDPARARWQHRLNRLNRIAGRGCNCNRETVEAIRAAGFTITELVHDELRKAPPIVRPLAIGAAVPG